MASPVIDVVEFTAATIVKYDVTDAQIAVLRQQCAALSAETPKGYEAVRVAIGNLRETRVAIEKRRVELKADALAYGRSVDSEAKRLTDILVSIEDPLKALKQAVDDHKARVKAEAEAEKLRALEAEIATNRAKQEAEAKALRDAEEARLAAEREALEVERRKLAEERRVADEAAKAAREAAEAAAALERDRLAAERRALEEAQRIERERAKAQQEAAAAKLRAEREALEAERRAVAAQREAAEKAERERLQALRLAQEAAAEAERSRLAEEARAARVEALRPDVDKLTRFAVSIRKIAAPAVRSDEAKAIVAQVLKQLDAVAALVDSSAAEVR